MARSVFCGPEDGTRNLRDPPSRQGEVQANLPCQPAKRVEGTTREEARVSIDDTAGEGCGGGGWF